MTNEENLDEKNIIIEKIPKESVLRKLHKKMTKPFVPQWALVILTFFIVVITIITTIFNYKYISIYKDTTQIETRSYIVVNDIIMEFDTVLKGSVELINVGKTPAYDVVVHGGIKIGGTGFYNSEIESIDSFFDASENRYATIGSGVSTFSAPYLRVIKKDDLEKILSGKKKCLS